MGTASVLLVGASRRGAEHVMNEDVVGINGCAIWSSTEYTYPPSGSSPPWSALAAPAAIVVADGVSGTADAHTAALMTAALASSWYRIASEADLQDNVSTLHRSLLAFARRKGESNESGSTLAGVIVTEGGWLVVFHVGDSRVYHHEATSLVPTEDDAAPLPMSDGLALSRWLGKHDVDTVPVHVKVLPPTRWRRLLLCTDGLVARLGDKQIEQILLQPNGSGGPSVRHLNVVMPDLMPGGAEPGLDDETVVLIDVVC